MAKSGVPGLTVHEPIKICFRILKSQRQLDGLAARHQLFDDDLWVRIYDDEPIVRESGSKIQRIGLRRQRHHDRQLPDQAMPRRYSECNE